jgi:hypothetical protein
MNHGSFDRFTAIEDSCPGIMSMQELFESRPQGLVVAALPVQ